MMGYNNVGLGKEYWKCGFLCLEFFLLSPLCTWKIPAPFSRIISRITSSKKPSFTHSGRPNFPSHEKLHFVNVGLLQWTARFLVTGKMLKSVVIINSRYIDGIWINVCRTNEWNKQDKYCDLQDIFPAIAWSIAALRINSNIRRACQNEYERSKHSLLDIFKNLSAPRSTWMNTCHFWPHVGFNPLSLASGWCYNDLTLNWVIEFLNRHTYFQSEFPALSLGSCVTSV